MHADPAIEADVKAVLARLAEVYVTRDVTVMRDIFAPDPDVVMYSPGAERVVGLPAIEAKAQSDWTKSESAHLAYRWISVSAAGPAAWAATEADFTVRAGGQEKTLPVRITFVLERRGEQWLIVQAHYSL